MIDVLCSGYLCTACCHPLSHHTELGCSELMGLNDDGYPDVCDCRHRGWDEIEDADRPARARGDEGG